MRTNEMEEGSWKIKQSQAAGDRVQAARLKQKMGEGR
jgi:hypothetical protein